MIGEDGQDGEIIGILRNSSEFLGRHDDRGGWSGQLENILMAYNIPMSQTRTIMEMQCLTCGHLMTRSGAPWCLQAIMRGETSSPKLCT